jgi:hypothetical protein
VWNGVLTIDDDGGGSGWQNMEWPVGTDHLFWTGFAVGNSATRMMNGSNGDWATTTGGTLTFTEPGVLSDEDAYAQYRDTADPNHLGLRVTQHSCAWEDTDFVLVAYVIENTTVSRINGLYAGHYVDFDVDDSIGGQTTAYDAARAMGYLWDTIGGTYVGLRYFTPAVSSYNWEHYFGGGSDADMYDHFSNGQFDGPSDTADQTFFLGVGSLRLRPGEEMVLGTAWVAGDGLAGLQANADQALAAWEASDGCGTIVEEFVPEPGSVMLLASGLMGLAGYAGLRKWKR